MWFSPGCRGQPPGNLWGVARQALVERLRAGGHSCMPWCRLSGDGVASRSGPGCRMLVLFPMSRVAETRQHQWKCCLDLESEPWLMLKKPSFA